MSGFFIGINCWIQWILAHRTNWISPIIRFHKYGNTEKIDNRQLSPHGYATYRLVIEFDQVPPLLGLSIPDFFTAYRLWVNGQLLAKAGTVGTNKSSTQPHWLPDSKPFAIDSTHLEIVLQVANFHHRKGGIAEPILLGTSEVILSLREENQTLTHILFGSFVICGLFLLGLFLFGQGDRAALYFALFCITHSYRIVGAENYALHHLAPWLPWWFTIKLEYISLFLSAYYFWKYIEQLYPSNVPKRLIKFVKWFSFLLCLLVLVTPANIFSYSISLHMPFLLFSVAFGSGVVLINFYRKWKANFYLTLGFLFLGMVMILGIGDIQGWWVANLSLFLIAYLSFLFFQSLYLSSRFAHFYKKALKAADAANEAKTNFLATMSHEIRTPMNGLIGMTNLLSRTPLTEEQKQYVNLINTSNKSLLNIINDILDLSKIEANQIDLENQAFELFPAIKDIIALAAPKAALKNLNLKYYFDPSLPKIVLGDINRLRQVLHNLINNALKFTEKGTINIIVSSKRISAKKVRIEFLIKDTGIGISQEELNKLFTPFTQANKMIAKKYGGTGLGLSISKKLVELMGGKMEVHSQLDQGSTFSFTLPFRISQIDSPSLKKQQKINAILPDNILAEKYPLRILVVEDNLVNQKLVSIILQKQGFQCDLANNGQEAIEAFDRGNYDLIFMDLQMPVTDGLAATQQILQNASPGKPPIIIAMTANVFDGEREKCLKAGMKDYLGKPIKVGEIENMIIKWGSKILATQM